jgi:hypothetical protein
VPTRVEGAPPPRRCIAVVPGPPEFVIASGAWWRARLGKFRIALLVARSWRRWEAGSRLLGYVVSRARGRWAVTLQARAGSEEALPLASSERASAQRCRLGFMTASAR